MLVALFNPVISSFEKPDDANDATGAKQLFPLQGGRRHFVNQSKLIM